MASPTFGMPSAGNNAPPPTFGAMTNPTGGNTNMFGGGGSFPNYPMFGSVTPTSSIGAFGSGGSMSGLDSGFQLGNNWQSFDNSLGKAYGVGTGQMLYSILNGGLFNPQVASSFLNAMQPGIAQGQSNISNAFGAEGSRFGSAEAYGLGQYNSQVNLNEQQTLANMFQNAQQEQLGLLNNILPTLHAERANAGGFWGDIAGFLGNGIFGGLFNAINSNGQSSNIPQATPLSLPGMGGNTGTFGGSAPTLPTSGPVFNQMLGDLSGGAALGGSDPFAGGGSDALLGIMP